MRVLLVQPPCNLIKTRLERKFAVHPLGLAYIASVLRNAGHEVFFLDCVVDHFDVETPARENFIRYGMPYEQIVARIREVNPEVVGVSAIQSIRKWESMEVCRAAKEVNRRIVTILGGSYPSCFPDEALGFQELDYAVIGEGERTVVSLLAAITAGRKGLSAIDGLAYRDGQGIVVQPKTSQIENLDTVPYPAWDILPMRSYSSVGVGTGSFGTRHYALMETSRGCVHDCHYCGKNVSKGSGYRVRSAENVIGEIDLLVKNYGIEEIQFEDYNCLSNMRRWLDICKILVERDYSVNWSMPHGMQVKLLNEKNLPLFKASGCDTLYLAVESANQRYLDDMGKGVQLDYTRKVTGIGRDLGLAICGYFMIGVLGETMDDIKATVDYALSLELDDVGFFIANPIPGSELYDKIIDGGYLVDGFDTSHIRYSMANVKSPHWTSADLQRTRHMAWRQNREENMNLVKDRYSKEFKTNIFREETEASFQCD